MSNISVRKYGWIFDNPDKFQQIVQRAVAQTTPQLPKFPKSRSRVRTGRMLQSWKAENLGNAIRVASEGVSYTIYNEFGTYKMAAQPMLTPSIPEMQQLLQNNIVRLIGDL